MAGETTFKPPLPEIGESQTAKVAEMLLIGELAQRCGLSTQSIRFYEREGLIEPGRSGTFRVYGSADIRRLEAVVALRKMGVPIVGIREIINVMLRAKTAERDRELARLLASHLEDLKRRQSELEKEFAATNAVLATLDKPGA